MEKQTELKSLEDIEDFSENMLQIITESIFGVLTNADCVKFSFESGKDRALDNINKLKKYISNKQEYKQFNLSYEIVADLSKSVYGPRSWLPCISCDLIIRKENKSQ